MHAVNIIQHFIIRITNYPDAIFTKFVSSCCIICLIPSVTVPINLDRYLQLRTIKIQYKISNRLLPDKLVIP